MGLILLISAFVAFGLFASSLTENQIVAAVLTFGILLFFWLLGWASQAGGGLAQIFEHLSIITHLDGFIDGVIELKDVAYYLSVSAFGLFLTHRVLDSTRWRSKRLRGSCWARASTASPAQTPVNQACC